MDLHDGSFDPGGHSIDGDEGLSEHTDPTAHSMIATGYEGPGTDDSLTSNLDDHLDDAGHLGDQSDSGFPEPDSAGNNDAMTGAATGDHDIDITINGQQFDGQATLDSDGDGRDDTAFVTLNEQGNQAAITDLNGDGQADEATLFDPDGNAIDHQHVDDSGTWIDDGRPGAEAGPHGGGPSVIGVATVQPDPSGSDAAAGTGHMGSEETGDEPIRMNLHGHEYQTTDTRDTDHDGTADTGVLPTSDGGELVVTDTDGDGTADHAEVYDPSGHDQGGIFVTSDGRSSPDGDIGQASDQPPAEAARSSWVVDPTTGDWVSG